MTATAYGSRQTSCAGKRQYARGREARKAARVTQSFGGGRMEAYRCQWCDWWHVGHDKRERS